MENKRQLNIATWNRREHFEFFAKMDEPYFGITLELDVTEAYHFCKANQFSFFAYYHYLSTRAANAVEHFRYRMEKDAIVIYDTIHINTILIRKDKSFCFSYAPYNDDFLALQSEIQSLIQRIDQTSGIGLGPDTMRTDSIHYSAIPWIAFKGLTHARSFAFPDSVPKISFGKTIRTAKTIQMPLAIFVHHGLMDAYHVGQYCELFQELLVVCPVS